MSAIYKKYRREWSTLVALLITFVLFSALEPSYLSATNVATIITQAVTYGLMGIGMTCVIISGGIDLSVGSCIAGMHRRTACKDGTSDTDLDSGVSGTWFPYGRVKRCACRKNETAAVYRNNGNDAGLQRSSLRNYRWFPGFKCTEKLSKCI